MIIFENNFRLFDRYRVAVAFEEFYVKVWFVTFESQLLEFKNSEFSYMKIEFRIKNYHLTQIFQENIQDLMNSQGF